MLRLSQVFVVEINVQPKSYGCPGLQAASRKAHETPTNNSSGAPAVDTGCLYALNPM